VVVPNLSSACEALFVVVFFFLTETWSVAPFVPFGQKQSKKMLPSGSSTTPPQGSSLPDQQPNTGIVPTTDDELLEGSKREMIEQILSQYDMLEVIPKQALESSPLRLIYCIYEFLLNGNRLHEEMRFPNLFVYPKIGNDEPYYDPHHPQKPLPNSSTNVWHWNRTTMPSEGNSLIIT